MKKQRMKVATGLGTDATLPTVGALPVNSDAASVADPTIWGMSTSFDLYDCDAATIRDADKIRQFVAELCDLIEMRRFGETTVVNFGEDERVAGFSMTQLIETSLISAHFANLTNTVYLDVFSCKAYDPQTVENFALSFFGGRHCIRHSTERL